MRKEEGLFELVLNSVPVRVFWKDLNLNFIGCNKTFAEDAGFSDPSDLIGKSDYDMGWKDQADLYRNDDREVIDTGIPKLNYEEPQTTPDGERILLRTSKMPLRDEDGVIIGVLGTYEDITWQRITEDTLLETQESYTDIFNTVTDAIYIQDLDGRFLDLNRGALDLYGYPKDEIVGNAPEFLGAPGKNNYDALSKMLTRVHKTGKPARFEFWGKRKDGTVFPKEVLVNRGKHFGKPVLIATARDITQTKAASAALASSEKRNRDTADFLETLLNSIPDVIGVQNDNHNIIRYNSAGYKFLGLSEAEVKGKKCYELIGGKIPCDNCATTEVYKTLKPARIEKYVPEMDIYFDVRSYPILDDSGRLKMVIEHLRDISDIKKAEKIQQIQYNIAGALVTATGISELMETVRLELSSVVNADNFFMALYNQTDDTLSAVHFVDQHDEFNSWKAEGTLSGRVVKENRPLLVKGSDISLDDEVSDEVIGTPSQCWLGVPLKVEERAIGVMVVQSYTNSAAYSEKTIELMELVANQVSLFIEGKRSVENAMKLLVGVEQSPVSMCITDKSGVVEFVNKAFCDTTGYSQEEIMGENPRILKSGYHPDTFYKEMWDTILKGLPWTGRFRNRKKNGEEYWANAVISPLIDKYGEITRFIAVQEDITKDIRMVEELRLAKEKAEENDRLKSAFLANMSHEIRTPMNGILGFIEIMQQPDLSEDEQKQYYDLIRQASVRLLNTINDIIEISKIESGQQSVNISGFNLGEVINFCNDFFRPEAYGKGLDFTLVNKLKDPDRLINSDRIKIESILTNLLKNAMKFTSAGFIKLSAYEESNQIVLSVEDSGIGIPPGSIETIFDRFVQADQSYSKYYEGSGLGLAISDAYARMLGGSLTVDSVQGKGSTFFLRIPELNGEIINNTGMDVKGKGSTTGLTEKNRGTHILVAEDDEASFMFLNHILRAEGYTVTRASTGEEVVDIVEKSPGIDLILMDIKMPGLDGWETTRIIKDKNPSMPIIAQTAYALISDQEKAMEWGFDGYISKPVNKELLFNMIKTHLGDLITE